VQKIIAPKRPELPVVTVACPDLRFPEVTLLPGRTVFPIPLVVNVDHQTRFQTH
jgi:hypothetical protein